MILKQNFLVGWGHNRRGGLIIFCFQKEGGLRGWLHREFSARAEFQPSWPGWNFSPASRWNPVKISRAIISQSFSPGLDFSPVWANRAEISAQAKTRNFSHVIVQARARIVKRMRRICMHWNQPGSSRAENSPCNQPLKERGGGA